MTSGHQPAPSATLAPLLPTGIYTIPEVSMVGETEQALKQQGVDFMAGHARYLDNSRGPIIGDDAGFLKLLLRRSDLRLLGVHLLGEQATEVAHLGLLALLTESSAELFNQACFHYPTLATCTNTPPMPLGCVASVPTSRDHVPR